MFGQWSRLLERGRWESSLLFLSQKVACAFALYQKCSTFAKRILQKMNIEGKRECRFYICIVMGYSLLMCGFYAPPIGHITNSALIAAGGFLCLGGLCVGVDIKGIIREFRMLHSETLKEIDRHDED